MIILDQKYTFKSIFDKPSDPNNIHIHQVSIPIIQRDYAQGRKTQAVDRIRDRFLTALYTAIINNQPITLDFVYGDVSDEGVLTPLDGQQRLTTLYLLHWYAAKVEKISVEDSAYLKNFTYETRVSARRFCEELINFTPSFTQDLSKEIIDQSWYQYNWQYDPTIQSMLVMLDAIQEKFQDVTQIWMQLIDNKIITFLFLQLKNMGLTDDLYIKMNSRGKPLTSFEHFKAEFENILKGHSAELANEVKYKFDLNWTDILFKYRNDNGIIDDEFMHYFYFISSILCYQQDIEYEQDEFILIEKLYASSVPTSSRNVQFLINSLDCWYGDSNERLNIDEFFNAVFTAKEYKEGKVLLSQENTNLFEKCCKSKQLSLADMLMTYAVILYRMNVHSITESQFINNIRIVRNLIWNSSDEIRRERMKDLLQDVSSIVLFSTILDNNHGFNIFQKEEERQKQVWCSEHIDKTEVLYRAESHKLLKGSIKILGLNNISKFERFEKIFALDNKLNIHRMLLTFGMYGQFNRAKTHMYMGTNKNDTWINLFHRSQKITGFTETSENLNQLLDVFDMQSISEDSFAEHINKYLEKNHSKDLRYYLIKYSPWLEDSDGYYSFFNPSKTKDLLSFDVSLWQTTRPYGKSWNMYLFILRNHSEIKEYVTLGYMYDQYGDKLLIKNTSYSIDCRNNQFIVYENDVAIKHIAINQDEFGIDLKDRVEVGIQAIKNLLS